MKFMIFYIIPVITETILCNIWIDKILGHKDELLKWATSLFLTYTFALFYRKIYDTYFK